ncbi:hypothetical protein [uncultured Aquimarina sp.]|uniref:hypothetical protein n=1 Tax=uncultured Aquimarina sp. TaxID=575652 RepID=UPI00262E9976|nr:hypothetical protein [uncultured Aquimarina sp.]
MEANTPQILIQLLLGLVYSIPTIFFIIISIHYLLKMGSTTDGILILLGNSILLLSSILGKIAWIQLVFYQKWEGEIYSYVNIVLGTISFIGSVLFVIGVFLLVKKVLKTKSLSA